MNSAEYWKQRSEQIAKLQYGKADQYEADLDREYSRALKNIQEQIERFYFRYSINNEIGLAETRKQLTNKELKEFKMTLSEFTAKAKNNEDGRWTKELNNVYYKSRISRFEALQVQIRQQLEMLAASRQRGTGNLLGSVYEDTYYRTLFELQKGTGIGVSFTRINKEGLETILSTEFAGSNWSKRIWGDRDKLAYELRTKISQSFIRGDTVEKAIQDVTERIDVSRSNAERLIQTESAFFAGQAAMAGYKSSGIIKKYEILATLDGRTSSICRGMDGKVFPLSEMEVSVNYPPFHARCRTTVVPYFDDEIDSGERIARDENGKTYHVPGDITYPEWKKRYVDSQIVPKSGIINGNGPSGAIKDPKRQQKHAETYYEFIRKRTDDVVKIAKNTGWKQSAIQAIKDHVFIKEHMLQGAMQRFYPDYEQAQVWQRLSEGKNIKDSDFVFLKHEFVELTQMRINNYTYEEAHEIANQLHNWYQIIQGNEE